MGKINWSESTPGYPVWIQALKGSESGWHRDDGDRYTDPDGCFWAKPDDGHYYTVHVRPEWSGEGLPPVGATVEIDYTAAGGEILTVRIIAHIIAKKLECAVFQHGDNVSYASRGFFRPTRTPEQIAADERESHVKGMLCYDAFGVTRRGLAEALYDAGYRKPE